MQANSRKKRAYVTRKTVFLSSKFKHSSYTVSIDFAYSLEIHKRSFSRFGVRLWNEIPRRMRDLPKKEFKGEIPRVLLNILVNENDYIETPIIVQKIGLAN